MQLSSTSMGGRTVWGAALAATCFVGTTLVRAEPRDYLRLGGDIRLFSGRTSDWDATSVDGRYIQENSESVAPESVRPTTEQEHLIATIRSFEAKGQNWDGEGAAPAIASSLRAASDFVCHLDSGAEMPQPMLHADGRAGLYWSEEDLYGELEFLSDNRIAYYFEIGNDKHKGVVVAADRPIPPVLSALIPG